MSSSSTPVSSSPALIGKAGVCSVDVQYVDFSWLQPWQRLNQAASSGTGFVIDGHRILTNAHVVESAVDVRVRLLRSPIKFKATVEIYAPDVDLALLKLDDPNDEAQFFYTKDDDDDDKNNNKNNNNNKRKKSSIALQFSQELPILQERVQVAGYPTGGDTICVTEGVVSRIDVRSVSVDNRVYVLCIQIDAAINSGNSGGPVFDKMGHVAGVAFQKLTNSGSDNIGYIIAASTVQAFLSRCGNHYATTPPSSTYYTLAPSVPYRYSRMFNRSLRLAHNVPDDIEGVLLTSVCEDCLQGQLKKGDILTKVDDYELTSDGQVYLRNHELIGHCFIFSGKCRDEPVVFTVYREGKLVKSDPIVLRHIPFLFTLFPTVDHQPEYLLIGPALFVPCSYGLAYQRTEADSLLKGSIQKSALLWPHEWDKEQTQIVLLVKLMAHDESFDLNCIWSRVLEYNGTPVQSLKHLGEMWEETRRGQVPAVVGEKDKDKHDKDHDDNAGAETASTTVEYKFARIKLEFQDDLVFEVKGAMKAEIDVMRDRNIPERSVILPSCNRLRGY